TKSRCSRGGVMARTPLARALQESWSVVDEANRTGKPLDEVRDERRTTRRRFLQQAGAVGVAAAGASALGRWAKPAYGAGQPKIVVVGAGLAGLTCAYRLKQAGLVAQVYEASTRIGG